MPEPTPNEIVLRAEKLAAAEGLDWFTMFRRASDRSPQATAGDARKEELLAEARKQLLAEQSAPKPDHP